MHRAVQSAGVYGSAGLIMSDGALNTLAIKLGLTVKTSDHPSTFKL